MAQISAAPHSLVPILGPDGAIAGIIGAYIVLYPRSRILVMVPVFFSIDIIEVPALAFIGFWFATQVILMMGRLIDPAMGGGLTLLSYAAGFGVGLGLGWLRQRQPEKRLWVT
jgi:rhomboid family protein